MGGLLKLRRAAGSLLLFGHFRNEGRRHDRMMEVPSGGVAATDQDDESDDETAIRSDPYLLPLASSLRFLLLRLAVCR